MKRPKDGHGDEPLLPLPLTMDRFVGRESEMAAVAALLNGNRVVTITGLAGVGKTRLALELAAALAPEFHDGAVFVPLAAVTGRAGIERQVASALWLAQQPGQSLSDLVVFHLRPRHLLMVLDNCEHVARAVATMVDELLEPCPGLTILVTSQEPLGSDSERVWPLSSLVAPDAGAAIAGVQASPVVRLFCERAAAVHAGFALTDDNAAAVAEICRRLDGVPLAVELASAWVAVLSPQQIAGRLDDRFALLTTGGRSGVPRHRSLQAALDWSHELCSGPERAVLRRLSVFAGDFPSTAATAVCADVETRPKQVPDILLALAARSLVVVDDGQDEPRYRLLQTVGSYARDRLADAGESYDVHRRHVAWCTALAESAEPGLTGVNQEKWLARLAAEHHNLRAALDWAVAHREAVLALRLAGALTMFWRVRGFLSEGREYLECALDLSDGESDKIRAKALWGAGFMIAMLGESTAAVGLLDRALNLYRELDDPQGQARALLILANCRVFVVPSEATPLLEQSVGLARIAGDDWCLAHALALDGLSHLNQGAPDPALPLLEETVAVARRSGDSQGLRIGLALLGKLALDQGDYDGAEAFLTESLAITRDLGETYGISVSLNGLGQLALIRGDYRRSAELLDEALATARAAANPEIVLIALRLRASLAQAQEDFEVAQALYTEGMRLAAEWGRGQVAEMRGLAEVALAQGELERARQWLGRALELARASRAGPELAGLLHDQAALARADGDYKLALSLNHDALDLRQKLGDPRDLLESLNALASLAAGSDRRSALYATHLLGATDALAGRLGFGRSPGQRRAHDTDVARVAKLLTAEEFHVSLADGAELSLDDAVVYAAKGRSTRCRPLSGWASLTKSERAVAFLAGAGLSNAEISERLFVGIETVKGHLKRVYAKLAITSRAEIVRHVPRSEASD